jgi:hypothetical protein
MGWTRHVSQPALALFPRSDPAFVSSVYASLVDGIDPVARQTRLRDIYPLAMVGGLPTFSNAGKVDA